jgi:3-methyladenine DNA glycosylase AlkD
MQKPAREQGLNTQRRTKTMPDRTAKEFTARLSALRSDPKDADFRDMKMGDIFKLGKEFAAMPVAEIEVLMESPIQKLRVGALSIMGQSAKGKKCTSERLAELYSLYIRRHDRINDWGLVDLAAYYVVGQYLADKPRDILYKLANSADQWERRTAIVATAHFILKLKQVEDTFAIAEILVQDPEKFVQTGTGWMLRTAGDVDRPALLAFLNKHAAIMPRITLRYSIEKLDKDVRDHYLSLKNV